jgi:hypothetical protein
LLLAWLAAREAIALRGDDAVRRTQAPAANAVVAWPLDGGNYRRLALEAAARGDTDAARRLMRVAARRSPRDREARAWLADDAIDRRDATQAFEHLDALLSMDVLLRAPFAPRLASIAAAQPAFRGRLLEALRAGAGWRREVVLAWISGVPLAQAQGLVDALGKLMPEERDAWATRLLAEGRAGDARRTMGGVGVWDGRFEALAHGPFDWQLQSGDGVGVDRVLSGHGGIALRVQLDGSRVAAPAAQQRLVAPAGRYRLGLRARFGEGTDPHAFAWTVECQDGRSAGGLQGAGAAARWTRSAATIVIPGGCLEPHLRLRVPPADGPYARGVAWFDDITLEALDPPTPGGGSPLATMAVIPLVASRAAADARALAGLRFLDLARRHRMRDDPLGP